MALLSAPEGGGPARYSSGHICKALVDAAVAMMHKVCVPISDIPVDAQNVRKISSDSHAEFHTWMFNARCAVCAAGGITEGPVRQRLDVITSRIRLVELCLDVSRAAMGLNGLGSVGDQLEAQTGVALHDELESCINAVDEEIRAAGEVAP